MFDISCGYTAMRVWCVGVGYTVANEGISCHFLPTYCDINGQWVNDECRYECMKLMKEMFA